MTELLKFSHFCAYRFTLQYLLLTAYAIIIDMKAYKEAKKRGDQ